MGWGGDGDRLLSAISSSSSCRSVCIFRLRSISTEPTMIFNCVPGDIIPPGCLVTSSRAAVSGTAVTGVEQRTTVDAATVAGVDGTTVLWILHSSCWASVAKMCLYRNFDDCSQLDCISETITSISASGTRDPLGIMVTYFNESSENENNTWSVLTT